MAGRVTTEPSARPWPETRHTWGVPRSMALALALALALAFVTVCLFSACVDELPVDVRTGSNLEVTVETREVAMVGQTDTVELQVVLDGVELTGLRVRWQSLDSTALAVRSLANSADLSTASLEDSLDATLLGEVSYLKRGTHAFQVQFDSVGIEGVQIDEVELPIEERWQSVSAGNGHTCAVTLSNTFEDVLDLPLRRGGEVFCWGFGGFGALGTGSSEQQNTPVRVASQITFEEVRSGNRYTCGRDGVGLLHCWGDNFQGQLGLGNRLDQFVPRLTALGEAFESFDVGKDRLFTCAVKARASLQEGQTLCWGQNETGQLGCGDLNGCDPGRLTEPNTAEEVSVIDVDRTPRELVSVSVGLYHACGVEEDGSAFCWGENISGELGASAPGGLFFSRFALEVEGGWKFAQIAAGGRSEEGFTCGLGLDSTSVRCWGRQVGGTTVLATPTLVGGLPSGRFSTLSAGRSHVCALTDQGTAYCWGANNLGQLGDGTTTSRTVAAAVKDDLTFGVLSAGHLHTCAITEEPFQLKERPRTLRSSGAIYCWGDDGFGQLGNGLGMGQAHVPTRVAEPSFKLTPLVAPGR